MHFNMNTCTLYFKLRTENVKKNVMFCINVHQLCKQSATEAIGGELRRHLKQLMMKIAVVKKRDIHSIGIQSTERVDELFFLHVFTRLLS